MRPRPGAGPGTGAEPGRARPPALRARLIRHGGAGWGGHSAALPAAAAGGGRGTAQGRRRARPGPCGRVLGPFSRPLSCSPCVAGAPGDGSPAESGPSPGEGWGRRDGPALPGSSGVPGGWSARSRGVVARPPCARCLPPFPFLLPVSRTRGGTGERVFGGGCSAFWPGIAVAGGQIISGQAGGGFGYLGSLPVLLSKDTLCLTQNLSGWKGAQASSPACSSRIILEHRTQDCVQTVLE